MQGKNYSLRFLWCFLVLVVTIAKSQTAPNINSLSPSVGPVSPVGGSVTIKGSGFGNTQGDSAVSFGGITDTPTSWNDTQIVVPVPSTLPAGFVDVSVTVNGVNSNISSFLVIPVITSISPEQGVVGTSVTITGTSFGDHQNDSTVTFNGTATLPSAWSNMSITVPAPVGASVGAVVVTVAGFSTNGATFFVLPNITGIMPAAASAGSLVTILGSGFGQIQGFGGVTFNGTSAAVQSWSDAAISVIVPDGATAGNVVVTTGLLLTSNGVNFTPSFPLTIIAVPDRTSNAADWYSAPVTVSFQCSGGVPPLNCPAAQTVSGEGANQIASGTATDSAGNTATVLLTINLDQTAPTIDLSTPQNGTTILRPIIRVTGSVSDSLSGVASVTCDGAQATLSSDSYLCNVSLAAGLNSIQVRATDNAGNIAVTSQISVAYSPIAPNAIFITPGIANMAVGNTRSVRLVGDVGQTVSGATWSISDPMIVSITGDDPPQLTAVAAGTATLTASFSQMQASMTVNVSGTALPFGTPLWTAGSITGSFLSSILPANPINDGDPDIYVIDGNNTLEGFTSDGQMLWAVNVVSGVSSGSGGNAQTANVAQPLGLQVSASSGSSIRAPSRQFMPYALQQQLLAEQQRLEKRLNGKGPIAKVGTARAQSLMRAQSLDASASTNSLLIQTVADNNSDAINVVFNCPATGPCQPFTPSLIAVDNASQSQLWENDLDDGPYLSLSAIAITPDNTIYLSGVFETGTPDSLGEVPTHSSIIAIDGTTGQTKFKMPIDPSHVTFTLTDESGNLIENEDMDQAAVIGPLAVMPDGSVQTMISSVHKSEADTQAHPPCILNEQLQCATSISNHLKLQLLTLQTSGSSSFQQVRSYDLGTSNCAPNCVDPGSANDYIPGDLIPDGLGGTLGSWTENQEQSNIPNQLHLSQNIRHLDGSGSFQDYSFPGLVPTNLSADQSANLVLGENNVALGVGAKLVAFDVTTGGQICSTSFLFPNGASLVAPAGDSNFLTAELTRPIIGDSEAIQFFDSSCTPTTYALPSTLAAVFYFNQNTFLGLDSDPFVEAFASPIAVAALGSNAWWPNGNPLVQRAPKLPKLNIDKVITFVDKDGFTQTRNVPLKGVAFGQSETVRITTDSSSSASGIQLSFEVQDKTAGSAAFDVTPGNGNQTTINPTTQAPAILTIKGVKPSSTADNIELVAKMNNVVIFRHKFSVVKVTIDPKFAGTIPDDNKAKEAYLTEVSPSSSDIGTPNFTGLGAFASDNKFRCAIGVQFTGTVIPTNYTGTVVLRRTLIHSFLYDDQANVLFEGPNTDFPPNDTSEDPLRDDDPQSGNSNGKVYDLDGPGPLNVFPSGTLRRFRANFSEYAVLDDKNNNVSASDQLPWYARVSCKTDENDPRIISLTNDIPGDNKGDKGTTTLTPSLQ